jgi:hypothetical protein
MSVTRLQVAMLAVCGAALAAGACSSGPRTPDEFRVVRKAPLTIPPEYNLRPPAPGESRPQELSPDAQARVAIFGADIGRDASEGEKLLVAQAGGDAVPRSVRAEVDYDTSKVLRKNRSFADAILSFGRTPPEGQNVDAAAEAERLRALEKAKTDLTGEDPVVIKRRGSGKLPGL